MPTAPKKRTTSTRRTAADRAAIGVATPVLPSPSHDAIATRAYQLFLERGARHGQDWEDWLTAERELQQ